MIVQYESHKPENLINIRLDFFAEKTYIFDCIVLNAMSSIDILLGKKFQFGFAFPSQL